MRLDHTVILQRDELTLCVRELRGKLSRQPRLWPNLIIFRLSCCAGLRRKEIVGLEMRDVKLAGARPHIVVRPEITKGEDGKRRRRVVPLWWSEGTHRDFAAWAEKRLEMGAGPRDPFVCSVRSGHVGRPISWSKVDCHWRTAIRPLGEERVEQLSVHSGRHSFISHALADGRTLAQVRDAAGHSSIAITDIYVHAIEPDEPIRDTFGFIEV
jgi:integrase